MTQLQPKIKVEHPCPMVLSRMKAESGFHCKSCDKEIIDFRGKSDEEIINYISRGTICGVFDNTQLVKQNVSIKYKIAFKLLTLLAIIGINVKPISAQIKQNTNKDAGIENQKSNLVKPDSVYTNYANLSDKDNPKKKWWRKNKKKKYRTIGCPSF